MSDHITIPVGAQLHQSWAKGTELEKSFSKYSATLSSEIEKVVTEAKEGTQEALTIPLQKYISDVCSETYQNLPDGAIPEWVVLAKNKINENLAIKVQTCWADIVTAQQQPQPQQQNNHNCSWVETK